MYCKTTYDYNTSNLNQAKFKCTAPYFDEEKENVYTATFRARMQENHDSNCSGCPKCGLYAQPSAFCYNGELREQLFREQYCTDCSRRNTNVGKSYVNEDELGHHKQDYVTVFKPRRTSKLTVSARGSMYGCDQINVEDVPLYKDVNKSKVYGTSENQRQVKTGPSNVENCAASNTSRHFEKCRDDSDKKFYPVERVKLNMMSSREHACSDGGYHKTDDIGCSEKGDVMFNGKSNRTSKGEGTQASKCTNSAKVKADLGNGNNVDPDKDSSKRAEKNRATFGVAKDGTKTSRKCTGNEEVKRNLGKDKIVDHPETEHSSSANKAEVFQEDNIAGKPLASEKDDRTRAKDEAFQQKDTERISHPKSVKTDEEAPKHGGRDRPRIPRGSKRMPRRRAPRKPHANVQHRDSEKPANGGVDEWLSLGGVDEWLFFVFDSIKKGVTSGLSGIPSYLSIGWSFLVYFFLVLILLILLVLSCIWALIKSCVVYLWDVLSCLTTYVRSLRNRIFQKQENANDTSEQQSRRPATRQRSDPILEADELVSKLLASKDLDAYETLGVLPSATDEEIKRKYRDMAKLVHPDKNAHEDASEAFKILQSAFEAIGDEEKRMAYAFDNDRKRFEGEMEKFFEDFMEKVQEMKNKIMCRVCQKFHPRLPTDRLIFAARYCADCGVRHPAAEGDVWVETSHMGFKYYCYLCTDGQVYEVTEWGACQGLLRMKANSHHVFLSVRSTHKSPWDDMFGENDRSGNNKKKRKSKGKSNKNKKRS